jgi:hypothetical protein
MDSELAGKVAPVNPYAAPRAEEAAAKLARSARFEAGGYVAQAGLATALLALLGLQAAADAVNGAACLAVLAGTSAEAAAVAVSNAMAGVSQTLFLGGAIPFGIFLVRANKNARAFERRAGEETGLMASFSPASMIWWFCVPFANLVKPYQAVRAVWCASAPDSGPLSSTLRSGVLSLWWGSWLASSIWQRMLNSAPKFLEDDPVANNVLVVIGSLLGIAACVSASRVVHQLQQRQAQRASELW